MISIFWQNTGLPQFFAKWKTTLISQVKEEVLNLSQMEDDINFKVNRRLSQFKGKLKTTSIC